MADKSQSRRGLLTNIGKGTAIASGAVVASSTTAAAIQFPPEGTTFTVDDDVPGSYEIVEGHTKGPRIMPYKIGWTISYDVPSKTDIEVVIGEGTRDKEVKKTVEGSGEFTVWTILTGRDEVRIRSFRPKKWWRID